MVPDGLSEAEVYLFVEELLSRYKEGKERLDHLDSLYELATRTLREADESVTKIISDAAQRARTILEEAEEQARKIKSEAKTESERQASSTISLAERRAQELILGAQATAERLLHQADSRARSQIRSATAEAPMKAPAGHRKTAPQQGGVAISGNKTRPTFRWKAVPRATRYGLYVCGPPYGKGDFVFIREDITDTALTLPVDLEKGVKYQWTIRAGNAKGWGKPSPFKVYSA